MDGVGDIPNLKGGRSTRQLVVVGFGDIGGIRIAEKHLGTRENQGAPCIDLNVVDIADGSGARHAYMGKLHLGAVPRHRTGDRTPHLIGKGVLGTRRGGVDAEGPLQGVVHIKLESGGLEVAACHADGHCAQPVGLGVREREVLDQRPVAVDDVTVIGPASVDDVVVVVVVHLMVDELVDIDLSGTRWSRRRRQAQSLPAVGGDEHVGIVVVGVGYMNKGVSG